MHTKSGVRRVNRMIEFACPTFEVHTYPIEQLEIHEKNSVQKNRAFTADEAED